MQCVGSYYGNDAGHLKQTNSAGVDPKCNHHQNFVHQNAVFSETREHNHKPAKNLKTADRKSLSMSLRRWERKKNELPYYFDIENSGFFFGERQGTKKPSIGISYFEHISSKRPQNETRNNFFLI